ncbi:integrator complex subunit 1 [uncultured Tenacibaculum sp.]|uniref:integrator complex subunit 1 n=1 Tax=uncultured Tenacibaculum sp. TaxID=174713 RepID=UPI0026229B9F|nr:integrator complex subunit 1 [uncultured Tenacibaculum sp.]
MESIEAEIRQITLEPKRETLVKKLISVVTGNQQGYIPEISNPEYFEIWFYHSFDLSYIVTGKENFTIKIGIDNDNELLRSILIKYNLSSEFDKEKIDNLIKRIEFDFFSDSWTEIENILEKKIRCFLIEHGVIRGWDVNKREFVDGEEIENILNQEGIPNHY